MLHLDTHSANVAHFLDFSLIEFLPLWLSRRRNELNLRLRCQALAVVWLVTTKWTYRCLVECSFQIATYCLASLLCTANNDARSAENFHRCRLLFRRNGSFMVGSLGWKFIPGWVHFTSSSFSFFFVSIRWRKLYQTDIHTHKKKHVYSQVK